MKTLGLFAILGLATVSAAVSANTLPETPAVTSAAQTCLDYGRAAMKENPAMLAILNKAKIDPQKVLMLREEINIGSQAISTKVLVKIKNGSKEESISCLYNGEKPLYFDWATTW